MGFSGTLPSLVTVSTTEGVTATSLVAATVTSYQAYLPLVWRAP